MPIVRLNHKVDFISAVRRGMSSVVREQLKSHVFPEETFFDEKQNEYVRPFEVALEHQRWSVALDLLENWTVNQFLLPDPLLNEDGSPRDDGPLIADTAYKRGINLLLCELQEKRDNKPLPKPLQERLAQAMENLVDMHGLDDTLFRSLAQQPLWMDWPARLLAAGANPNHVFINKEGSTVAPLDLAGAYGNIKAVNDLLGRGANPLYKHHNFEGPAHRVADLKRWRSGQEYHSVPDLDAVIRRLACLDRLLAIPGVSDQMDHFGYTPQKIKEKSLEWLSDQPLPGIEPHLVAQYHNKKMNLLLAQQATSSIAPKARF